MINLSNKVLSINESPIRKLAPLARAAAKAGKRVIPLNIGQPDIYTPKEYYKAIRDVDSEVIAYTDSNGIDELKSAFTRYYAKMDMPFTEDDILITAGGSEALLFSYACICDQGDEILAFEPFYPNYNSLAKLVGAKISAVTCHVEDGFRIPDKAEILKKITPRTKAIMVTNPNNPTGTVLTKEEMDTIVDIALEKDLFIISDEVYREYVYSQTWLPFSGYGQILDRLIVIDSVSKRYSGCGIRIGCIATKNHDIIANSLKLAQARLSVPLVEQIGAAALFDTADDYIRYCHDEYEKRRDILYEGMKAIPGAGFIRPCGAFYLIASLPVENSEDFASWLLTDYDLDGDTVTLCPAKDFYATPGLGLNEVRISYCLKGEDLSRALHVIACALEKYNK